MSENNNNTNRSENLGAVTAYGIARAAGYSGTKAQFAQGLVDSASAAADAQSRAAAAAGSATAAAGSATAAAGSAAAAAGSADTAEDHASDAEAYAVGKRGGVDVASGDPAYHNNAKYYAEEADAGVESLMSSVETSLPAQPDHAHIPSTKLVTDNFARNNGAYDEMSVGSAAQLISGVPVIEKAPFLLRASGGSLDIGDRKELSLVGGSLVFNQKVNNGRFSNGGSGWTAASEEIVYGSGKVTVSVPDAESGAYKTVQKTAADATTFIEGHIYLYIAGLYTEKGTLTIMPTGASSDGHMGYKSFAAKKRVGYFWQCPAQADGKNNVCAVRGLSNGDGIGFTAENVMCFDLSAMFGSAVASYIKSANDSSDGAGLSIFTSFFPNRFYAAQSETLLSASPTAHETVGFNLFDLVSGKARVVGGMTYQITGAYTSLSLAEPGFNVSITPNATTGKFKIEFPGELSVEGADETTCVHLVYDGERDGESEEYSKHAYPLGSVILRGAPTVGETGIVYEGDTYSSDGTLTRKYEEIDMGDLTFTKYSPTGTEHYIFLLSFPSSSPERAIGTPVVCASYAYGGLKATSAASVEGMAVGVYSATSSERIILKDESYADAAAAKAALTGVKLIYKRAEPEEESAAAYASSMAVDNWGTERFVDERSIPVPVGHITAYQRDLRSKIETLPDLPVTDGTYLLRRDGEDVYYALDTYGTRMAALERSLPTPPGENGSYVLRVTVSGAAKTYEWVSET